MTYQRRNLDPNIKSRRLNDKIQRITTGYRRYDNWKTKIRIATIDKPHHQQTGRTLTTHMRKE